VGNPREPDESRRILNAVLDDYALKKIVPVRAPGLTTTLKEMGGPTE
jgi:hypothetical protein